MGNIVAVRYRLFEGEEPALALALAGQPHELGGEVVVRLDGGRQVYISWASEPIQYAIATRDASFFAPDAALQDHEVSASPFWNPMVGHALSAQLEGGEHQILRLSSPSGTAFACAYERGGWYADAVTICWQVPEHGA